MVKIQILDFRFRIPFRGREEVWLSEITPMYDDAAIFDIHAFFSFHFALTHSLTPSLQLRFRLRLRAFDHNHQVRYMLTRGISIPVVLDGWMDG